jgi:hypothetical protein
MCDKKNNETGIKTAKTNKKKHIKKNCFDTQLHVASYSSLFKYKSFDNRDYNNIFKKKSILRFNNFM